MAKDYLVNKRLTEKNFPSQNFIPELISGQEACDYVLLNEFEGIIYYNRERFDSLINWLFGLSYIKEVNRLRKSKTTALKNIQKLNNYIKNSYLFIEKIKDASENASYKILELKNLLSIRQEAIAKKTIKKKPTVKAAKSKSTITKAKTKLKKEKTVRKSKKKKN